MSVTTTPAKTPPPPAGLKGNAKRKFSVAQILLIVAGALILVSAVRVITGADQLTSEGQISASSASPCRSAWRAWRACGPSGPAWSTSALRA